MSEILTIETPKSEANVSESVKVTPEYEAAVTKFADEKKNQRFLNDSRDHARLLAKLMIGRTNEYDDVLIYSKCLPASCFGDALKHSKSGNIRIILDDAGMAKEIDNLPREVNDRIKLRIFEGVDGAHFFVAGNSFRLEIDHDNAKAVANFNEPSAVKKLTQRFESLWGVARQIENE